jgi:hypothetical protein
VITQARLKELLSYNPVTGHFIRLVTVGGQEVGTVAGQRTTKAVQIRIDKGLYLAHRLAWLYMTGEWPDLDIDHANCNRRDNRWTNLRLATKSDNCCNTPKRGDNTSGFKGVVWHKSTSKWMASIQRENRRTHLGLFDCPAAAHFVYLLNAASLHGGFARTE